MANEDLHYDEDTLRKVYAALLECGIYGEQAVGVVSNMQNHGILFREMVPKRRGRPPKKGKIETFEEASATSTEVDEAWQPKESS